MDLLELHGVLKEAYESARNKTHQIGDVKCRYDVTGFFHAKETAINRDIAAILTDLDKIMGTIRSVIRAERELSLMYDLLPHLHTETSPNNEQDTAILDLIEALSKEPIF